jgi:hypothetical protein
MWVCGGRQKIQRRRKERNHKKIWWWFDSLWWFRRIFRESFPFQLLFFTTTAVFV